MTPETTVVHAAAFAKLVSSHARCEVNTSATARTVHKLARLAAKPISPTSRGESRSNMAIAEVITEAKPAGYQRV